MKITRRVKNIIPSLTLEITALAKKLKKQGRAIINFAAGELDFDTPDYIKAAAIDAIRKGFTKYTPASGILELKKTISKKLSADNGLRYNPAQIVISCGAKHSLYNILQVLCGRTDEVILASPYWVSYPEMITLTGARVRIIKTSAENKFKLTESAIAGNLSKKTKLLILNSPGNPTGCVYFRSELQQIAALADRYNFYVLSDEVYEKLIFDGKRHISIASLSKQAFKRSIVVNGVSKTYAMTGWRIGYLACADANVIDAVNRLQSHSTSNPCSISQMAALVALQKPARAQIGNIVGQLQRRRNLMLNMLGQIPKLSFVKPDGGFYIFCNISRLGLDSVTFCQRLLREKEVAAVPGKAFGRDDYVRLSFATGLRQIRQGLRKIKDWVETAK